MAVIRKRLIFWLIKAYIKKSGKTLVISFLVGLFIFFAIAFSSKYFATIILPFSKKEIIGIAGAYTQDALPLEIIEKLSSGLTKLAPDGTIQPSLASSWETKENGKVYIFHLKPNQHFTNGKEVTSETITYDFSDVTTEKPDKYTIVFKLKDAYSPFLVTVSRPLLGKNYTGVGAYRLEAIKLNGNFVQSLTLSSVKNRQETIRYEFYPNEESLKMAFLLGEVSKVSGLTSATFKNTSLDKNFPHVTVTKQSNEQRLVTLFFNTTDPVLSDKKIRLGLSYALPDIFKEGERAFQPYSHQSAFYNPDIPEKKQDYNHAKLLLIPAENASGSGQQPPSNLTIKTLKKYRPTAEVIAASWKNIAIQTKIEEVDSVPDRYQIFLGDFLLPKDPDQYTLWHSDQRNNITRYKNLRIDKLLEDGRKTVNETERKKLYADFQKYLSEDAPAAFLYFPTEYTIVRD